MLIPTLMLGAALSCGPIQLVNNTYDGWTDYDKMAIRAAVDGCARRYPHAPCLTQFIKKGYQDYQAICRPEEQK